MPYLTFYPVLENALAVAALLIALGTVIVCFPAGRGRLSRRQQRILMAIRFMLLLLLTFALLRPTLLYTETHRLAASLPILLDTSESMTVADEAGGKSRYETARQALTEARGTLQKMQRHLEIGAFSFDRSPHPLIVEAGVMNGLPEKPDGQETALGYALEQVLIRSQGKRILGTILLTDGTQRSRPPRDALPQDAAARYRDALTPIFPVRLGQGGSGDLQDVAVIDMLANDRVFVKNDFQISGTVRITGYLNQPIPVRLLFEDENGQLRQVAQDQVVCREEGQLLKVRFAYAPPKVGQFKYMIEIPSQPKELIATNNSITGFVRVVEGGLRVMYLQGDLRNEHRFIKEALDASADIHVSYHRFRIELARRESRKSGRPVSRLLDELTERRASLVPEIFAPEEYNVYILDDIDSRAFKREELTALANLVGGGTGLLMLGGNHAFGAGGYYETPLEPAVPFVMSPLDRQSLDQPVRGDLFLADEMAMLPNERGLGHPVMRLESGRAANEAAWRELPGLKEANRFGQLKPGATVLAQSPPPQELPLLVTQLFGEGRVIAFAGDSTWRWAMHGFRDRQKRFWRQIILWLAKMDDSAGNDCWITLEKSRLYPGEPVGFQVFLKSKLGEGTVPMRAEAELLKPDGRTESVPLLEIEGGAGGTIRSAEQPGDYTIRVRAMERDRPADDPEPPRWREATVRFMVFDQNLELDNPVAYPNLLENMAATSEGRTIAPEQLGSLLEELEKRAEELVERRETKRSLYDTWTMLVLMIGTFALDWFLRKKWGLV